MHTLSEPIWQPGRGLLALREEERLRDGSGAEPGVVGTCQSTQQSGSPGSREPCVRTGTPHARAASSPRPLGPYFESSLPPRKPGLRLEAQWLPLPTLCVTHRGSPLPRCGPDLLEVSPLQSCLKQEFPSPGMPRTSPPVRQLTRAPRARMPGSSSLLPQPRVGLGGPPRSAASPGFPDVQGARPLGLGQPLVETAARRLSSRRGRAVAPLLAREQRHGTPGRCEISAG